jgi:hypothetical protein
MELPAYLPAELCVSPPVPVPPRFSRLKIACRSFGTEPGAGTLPGFGGVLGDESGIATRADVPREVPNGGLSASGSQPRLWVLPKIHAEEDPDAEQA